MTQQAWIAIILVILGLVVMVWAYARLFSRLHADALVKLLQQQPNLFSEEYEAALDAKDKAAARAKLVDLAISKLRSKSPEIRRTGVQQLAQIGDGRAIVALTEAISGTKSWELVAKMAEVVQVIALRENEKERRDAS